MLVHSQLKLSQYSTYSTTRPSFQRALKSQQITTEVIQSNSEPKMENTAPTSDPLKTALDRWGDRDKSSDNTHHTQWERFRSTE